MSSPQPKQKSADLGQQLRSYRSSVLTLLVANSIPLILMLTGRFDVFQVTFLFWVETFVVGILAGVKGILRNRVVRDSDTNAMGFLLGLPVLMAGLLVYQLQWFGPELHCHFCGTRLDVNTLISTVTAPGFMASLAALVISHLYSFFYNTYDRDEYRTDAKPLERFYNRILLVQVFIQASGVLTVLTPIFPVFLVGVSKIVADVYAHLRERRSNQTRTVEPTPGIYEPTRKPRTQMLFAISALLVLIAAAAGVAAGASRSSGPAVLTCENFTFKQFDHGITAEYCQGFACGAADNKKTCEDIDVILGSNVQRTGSDGTPDCIWNEVATACYARPDLAGAQTPIPAADLAWIDVPELAGKTFSNGKGSAQISNVQYVFRPTSFGPSFNVRWNTSEPAETWAFYAQPNGKNEVLPNYIDDTLTTTHQTGTGFNKPGEKIEFAAAACPKPSAGVFDYYICTKTPNFFLTAPQ